MSNSSGWKNEISVLDLIYAGYTEHWPVHDDKIRVGFENLRMFYNHMSEQEFDEFFARVSDLCCAHENVAFQEGVRVGIQLAEELKL